MPAAQGPRDTIESAASLRAAIFFALSLPTAGCGETYEDEKCLPIPNDGQCVPPAKARAELNSNCIPGRPFVTEDVLRFAEVRSGRTWSYGLRPGVKGLTSTEREQLAAAWLRTARGEHASVAAFSRLSLELMRFGAPPRLLLACHAAAADEVQHARGAFTLASAYAGTPFEPGSMEIPRDLVLAEDPTQMAAAAAREGCRDETLAALLAAESAREARDPAVRAFLRRVAEDETRHAALSWQVLAWALSLAPDATAQIDEILGRAHAPARQPDEVDVPARGLSAHGQLRPARVVEIMQAGRAQVLRPRWQALRAA